MKKKPKKSDHKHIYELVELVGDKCFSHEEKCKICGHVYNRVFK